MGPKQLILNRPKSSKLRWRQTPVLVFSALISLFFVPPLNGQDTKWEFQPTPIQINLLFDKSVCWDQEIQETLKTKIQQSSIESMGGFWRTNVAFGEPAQAKLWNQQELESLADQLQRMDIEDQIFLQFRHNRKFELHCRHWNRKMGWSQTEILFKGTNLKFVRQNAFKAIGAAFGSIAKIKKIEDNQIQIVPRGYLLAIRQDEMSPKQRGRIYQFVSKSANWTNVFAIVESAKPLELDCRLVVPAGSQSKFNAIPNDLRAIEVHTFARLQNIHVTGTTADQSLSNLVVSAVGVENGEQIFSTKTDSLGRANIRSRVDLPIRISVHFHGQKIAERVAIAGQKPILQFKLDLSIQRSEHLSNLLEIETEIKALIVRQSADRKLIAELKAQGKTLEPAKIQKDLAAHIRKSKSLLTRKINTHIESAEKEEALQVDIFRWQKLARVIEQSFGE